jgi:hypothetical protein
MAIREGQQVDTLPVQVYGKGASGLPVSLPASNLPYYNSTVIDDTDPNNITVLYKLDGTTVATKTIVTVGHEITITVT